MSALLSGLMAGGWPFLVGWVLPSALSASVFLFLLAPSDVGFAVEWQKRTALGEAATVVAAAVALGVLLSAIQTPLYRVLEGYYLPEPIQKRRQEHHRQKRDKLKEELDALRARPGGAGRGVRSGLKAEKLRQYPYDDEDVAPTNLANAIRVIETYGWYRFMLDSQALWYELVGVAPDKARQDEERARAGVDFFVAMLYLSVAFGISTIGIAVLGDSRVVPLVVAGTIALCLLPAWYSLAVVSTRNWYSSVQALVHLGRKPLADALNLALPRTIEEEREMWRGVGWLVKYPYDKQSSVYLERFSKDAPEKARAAEEQVGEASEPRVSVSPEVTAGPPEPRHDGVASEGPGGTQRRRSPARQGQRRGGVSQRDRS